MSESAFAPSPLALLLAFAIDRLWGELPARLHPVVWIGQVTTLLMRAAPAGGATLQTVFGAGVALLVPGSCAALAAGALLACGGSLARLPVEALLLSTLFAIRALGEAALRVRAHLERDRLDDARLALRDLCSRDPSALAPHELAAAAIESTAENSSDSFVAPLFYYALLGLPGAAALPRYSWRPR